MSPRFLLVAALFPLTAALFPLQAKADVIPITKTVRQCPEPMPGTWCLEQLVPKADAQ